MTDDGKTPKELSGHLVSSMTSISDFEVLDIASESATKVIPLLTGHPSNRGYAWNVKVFMSYSNGFIPQIYMWWVVSDSLTDEEVLLSARANLQGINGNYSVKSRPNGKALICVSSFKEESSQV